MMQRFRMRERGTRIPSENDLPTHMESAETDEPRRARRSAKKRQREAVNVCQLDFVLLLQSGDHAEIFQSGGVAFDVAAAS
jgi:hypothetical protein